MSTIYRHGDVLIRKIDNLPQGIIFKEKSNRVVLALGEITGHSHVATSDKPISLVNYEGLRYMLVEAPTKITHEEHVEIIIEEGIYQIDQEQEFDYATEVIAQVRD